MKKRQVIEVLLLAFIYIVFSSEAIAENREQSTVLYCTGTSWDERIAADGFKTDAIIRISDKGVYLEVSNVGAGSISEPLKQISSITVIGDMTLQRGARDASPKDVSVNLNRYSGQLLISPSSSMGGKVLFLGECKPTNPLF